DSDLDVAQSMAVEMRADELDDALRVLVGDEAEIELGQASRRKNGLRPRAPVATVDPVHVEAGLGVQAPLQFEAGRITEEALDPVLLAQLLTAAWLGIDRFTFGVRQRTHVVVEPVDRDATVRVAHRRDRGRETVQRVVDDDTE